MWSDKKFIDASNNPGLSWLLGWTHLSWLIRSVFVFILPNMVYYNITQIFKTFTNISLLACDDEEVLIQIIF